ncbi:COMM domain-containing protein 6-like [Crassostrea angulata]|nr:COMM domain-containing protein 6 [Crassostrea gigas]XP_052672990.1 COMM domain-containing protein 6-like [Crassostrea angulata]
MDLSERGLTAGKLVDMKWKLGVAVCSDECKSLNSPFVAMTLKVADASGKISTHTFELTIPQFQNFSEQMKDMAARMEMI